MNEIEPIGIRRQRRITVILGGIYLFISIVPLVHSISICENPHCISLANKNSGHVIPLLFMEMFNESYMASYARENDPSDIHTLIDKAKVLHKNIFVVPVVKTLSRIIQGSVAPSEKYISKKASIKMRGALLPVGFCLLIDCCHHNTSPPSQPFTA